MSKFKLWVGIVLVFILGALAGSLGMGMYIQHRFERHAFGPPPHKMIMHFQMRRLDKALDLTETQENEIEKIMTQTMDDVHAIMKKQQPELEKLVKESLEQLKDKLNPEQKEKFKDLKLFDRMKKRLHHKGPFRPGLAGETPDRVASSLRESLELSKAQEEKVRAIFEEHSEKRRKIFDTYSGQDRHDRKAMRNEMHELQEATEKQLEKMLTQEQMDLYLEIQEEKRMHMHDGRRPPGPFGLGKPLGP